jgi:hypothetical protein
MTDFQISILSGVSSACFERGPTLKIIERKKSMIFKSSHQITEVIEDHKELRFSFLETLMGEF